MNEKITLHPHDHKKIRDWQLIIAFLETNLANQKINKVLELGGGFGNIGYHFANGGAMAVVEDINELYLEEARGRHPNISTLCHNINASLPYNNGSFDLVTCTGTLHYGYIKDAYKIIEEMVRVSRRYLLIDFLSRYAPYRLLEKLYNPHYAPQTYSRREVLRFLSRFRLRVVAMVGSKTFPLLNTRLPFTGKTVYCLCERF